MKISHSIVGLALSISACGRPLPVGISNDETESGDETTTTTSATTTSSAPASTDETDETDETDSDGGLGFVAIPDHGCWFPCDLVLQDCPTGEKCVPQSSAHGGWYSPVCVPVLGEQAPGEPCTHGGVGDFTDDCDATSFCWDVMDVEGEAIGECHSFCLESYECAEEMHACVQVGQDGPHVCLPSCDPVLQDCGDGLGCFWVDTGFSCVFTTQEISAGEPCGFVNDCAAGTGCVDAEVMPGCIGAACCSPFCQVELGDDQCAAVPGTACVPFFEQDQAPAGYEDVGVCIVPP